MSQAQEMVNSVSGWGALDLDSTQMNAERAKQSEQIKLINGDMRELFMDTPLGRRVLQTLVDWTVKRPTAQPEASPNTAFFREGQNDIVRSILSACHNSESGDK